MLEQWRQEDLCYMLGSESSQIGKLQVHWKMLPKNKMENNAGGYKKVLSDLWSLHAHMFTHTYEHFPLPTDVD